MDPAVPGTPADAALARAAELAREFVATLLDRPIHATTEADVDVSIAAIRRIAGDIHAG